MAEMATDRELHAAKHGELRQFYADMFDTLPQNSSGSTADLLSANLFFPLLTWSSVWASKKGKSSPDEVRCLLLALPLSHFEKLLNAWNSCFRA